jgi:hypothetical protein
LAEVGADTNYLSNPSCIAWIAFTPPHDLTVWMREFGFLAIGKEPTSLPPSLEILAYGGYFIRSVISESIRSVIIQNLRVEGLPGDA